MRWLPDRMLSEIDVKRLLRRMRKEAPPDGYVSAREVLKVAEGGLGGLPSADGVQVIRCKDCRHHGLNACPMRHNTYVFADEPDDDDEWYDTDMSEPDGFCYMGEAKEEEE